MTTRPQVESGGVDGTRSVQLVPPSIILVYTMLVVQYWLPRGLAGTVVRTEVMDGYCQTRRNLGCQQSNLFRKRSQNAYLGTNKQLNVPHHSSPNKRLYSLSVPSGSTLRQTLHFLEDVSTSQNQHYNSPSDNRS